MDADDRSERLLSLAAGTVLDLDPAAAVGAAATAGWPAVGVWFDPQRWTAGTAEEVRARFDDTGLVALDIEPVLLAPDGPVVTDAAKRLADAAIDVGARHVLVASRDPDHARVAAAVHDLCDRVGPHGIRVVLEFLPIMAVRTLAEAAEIVASVEHPAAGVLVDALHLSRSGGLPSDLASLDPALLPYAQLCDAAAEAPTDFAGLLDEALHGRLLPGDGALPLADLLAALPAGIPLSLEMRSRRLIADFPDPAERASAVLGATRRLLTAIAGAGTIRP